MYGQPEFDRPVVVGPGSARAPIVPIAEWVWTVADSKEPIRFWHGASHETRLRMFRAWAEMLDASDHGGGHGRPRSGLGRIRGNGADLRVSMTFLCKISKEV